MIDFLNCYMNVPIPCPLEAFCVYYFVFSSAIYALLRLNEPVVLATFKHDIIRCCRRDPNKNASETEDDMET